VGDRLRILIVSPVRNEAEHIERTVAALAEQTRPPDCWLVIDDGSEDRTLRLLEELSSDLPFMRVLATPPGYTRGTVDRHAVAAAPRAFNWALRHADVSDFTHLGKLDGDIELPPDYFERLLERFEEDSALGVAGGTLVEPARDGRWKPARVPPHHVRGALKLYSRACFEAIGGVEERLGWDTIDEVYARMRGFRTRSFDDLVARHHRPVASADGRLRGHARFGRAFYTLCYGLPWVTLRSMKVAAERPYGISAVAFMYGYVSAAAGSCPRIEDEEYRRCVKHELRGRMLQVWRRPVRSSHE
jgi:poly-beta-1,6-N-acetyl-D-glucosamine synthase